MIAIFNCMNTEVNGIPVESLELSRQKRQASDNDFETAITAGISPADGDDDCFEAAVNGGVAKKPDVGVDLKFFGLNSGGIRCKQGIPNVLLPSILQLFHPHLSYNKQNILLHYEFFLGVGSVFRGGAGPLEGSLSADTSIHLADTKVEANLLKSEIEGNLGGIVGASFATGAGINIGLDEKRLSVGTDITTPIGSFGGHVGCVTEVCLFACVNVRIC